LPVSGQSSVLLIGKNGSGKTTVGRALEILQKITRGKNRVRDLVNEGDLARGRADVPMRFEIEVELKGKVYGYAIAFEFPVGFRELRVREESFIVDGKPVYRRELAEVHLVNEASFRIDWHLVALPIVQEQSTIDPLFIFKQWLTRMLILQPAPGLIGGDSEEETLQPNPQVTDFAAWFSGLVGQWPAAYARIDSYLREVLPDLKDIKNPLVGTKSKSLSVQFSTDRGSLTLPFGSLSDGEKCYMISALVLAAIDVYEPMLCFWDEPDNYLALDEVGHFIVALRKAFQSSRSQFIATSHNQEAINRFSDENTLYLYRNSHVEPTVVRPVSDLRASGSLHGDLVNALVRGDVNQRGEPAP